MGKGEKEEEEGFGKEVGGNVCNFPMRRNVAFIYRTRYFVGLLLLWGPHSRVKVRRLSRRRVTNYDEDGEGERAREWSERDRRLDR